MPSAAPSARSAASTAEARPSAKAETPSARAASPPAPSPAAAAKTTAAAAEQPAVRAPVAAAADDTGPADAASPASADTPKPELRAVAATPPVEVTAAPAPPVEPPAASAPKPVPDRDAVVLERHEPTWPARALRNAAGSEIVLRVQVGPDGRISRVVVERGPGVTELETAAISAVLRWRFDPAVRDGRPVESWTSLRFEPR